MRVFRAAAVIALLAGPAAAQTQAPVPRYGDEDKAKSPQQIAAEKEAERAYKRSLGNIPDHIRGRRTTGYTLEGDRDLQRMFGSGFLIPHYPQKVLEDVGSLYTRVAPNDPYVVKDGKLVTGQNQQSASEYALVFLHTLSGASPVSAE